MKFTSSKAQPGFTTGTAAKKQAPRGLAKLFRKNGNRQQTRVTKEQNTVPTPLVNGGKNLTAGTKTPERVAINKIASHYEDLLSNDSSILESNKGRPPKIQLQLYLYRLVKLVNDFDYKVLKEVNQMKPGSQGYRKVSFGLEALMAATCYMNQALSNGLVLNELNIHRVFCVSMLTAIKVIWDFEIHNSEYAPICGLTLKEINSLEVDFLVNTLKFKTHLTKDDLKKQETLFCYRC